MIKLQQIQTAKQHGILNPVIAWNAARRAGIPFWVMCAFLMQESGGGSNIYGHDIGPDGYPRPFWGHGEVTEANYAAYKIERDLGINHKARFSAIGRRTQGVGPMQLTWYSFQDEADALGGCWKKSVNMLIGAKIIKQYYDEAATIRDTEMGRWRYAAYKYNGKQSYVDSIAPKLKNWQELLT